MGVLGHANKLQAAKSKLLSQGTNNIIQGTWPMGGFYRYIRLRFTINITHGSGSGPVTEGELLMFPSITLRTTRGEYILNQVPARALYYMNMLMFGTAPTKTAIDDVTGAYYVELVIPLIDPRMRFPQDSVLDTRRYQDLILEVQVGTIATLLGSPGTDTCDSVYLDAFVDAYYGTPDKPLPGPNDKGYPKFYQEYTALSSVAFATDSVKDLERDPSLAIKRILVCTANSATAVPFSGTPANTTLADLSLETESGLFIDHMPWLMMVNDNKVMYQMETALTGYALIDFVAGKSIGEVLSTVRSRLQFKWTTSSLSTSFGHFLQIGTRPLK